MLRLKSTFLEEEFASKKSGGKAIVEAYLTFGTTIDMILLVGFLLRGIMFRSLTLLVAFRLLFGSCSN